MERLNKTQQELADMGKDFLTYTDPHPGKDDGETVYLDCTRCSGKGRIKGYGHVQNGVCFKCNGRARHVTTVGAERRRARDYVNRTNRDRLNTNVRIAEVERKRAELADIFAKNYPDVTGILTNPAYQGDKFVISLNNKFNDNGYLSDSQVETLREVVRRIDNAEPVPTGKVEIIGKILGIKTVFSDFGGSVKMLVEDDRGFRVWGTLPRALYDVEDNARVVFTADITQSNDDPLFGFFKRPSKARVL